MNIVPTLLFIPSVLLAGRLAVDAVRETPTAVVESTKRFLKELHANNTNRT